MTDDSRRDRVGEHVDEITKLLHKIEDPVQLSNVHDWVVKLTTGDCGGHETDYLRLLEYTLKSDGAAVAVREPFASPPPDGPLEELGPRVTRRTVSLAAGGADDDGRAASREESPELIHLLDRTDEETVTVHSFVAEARRYTCDGGALMDTAVRELLDDYRQAVRVAFDDRADKLSDALAKEQAVLMFRYRANGQRMLSRAQILQDHVRELMPAFRWDEYVADPDGYVRRAVQAKKRNGDEAAARKAEGCARPDENAGEEEAVAVAVDVGQTVDDENDDDDEDEIHAAASRRKKLMATLDWLRSEVVRADCETADLVSRYDAAVVAIGVASKRKMANECEARARRLEAKIQLDELRQESARQVATIDSYVKTLSSDPGSEGGGALGC